MIKTFETRNAARVELLAKGYQMSRVKSGLYWKPGYRATIHPVEKDIKVRVVIDRI